MADIATHQHPYPSFLTNKASIWIKPEIFFRLKKEWGKQYPRLTRNIILINKRRLPRRLVMKNPLANAGDTGDMVRSRGWEGPLEKEMTTHSSILAWKIPQTEEPGRPVYWLAKSQIWLSTHAGRKWKEMGGILGKPIIFQKQTDRSNCTHALTFVLSPYTCLKVEELSCDPGVKAHARWRPRKSGKPHMKL